MRGLGPVDGRWTGVWSEARSGRQRKQRAQRQVGHLVDLVAGMSACRLHGGFLVKLIGSEGTMTVAPTRPGTYMHWTDWDIRVDGEQVAVPADYRTVPFDPAAGPVANVAAVYQEIARSIADGRPPHPDFHTAAAHHRALAQRDVPAAQRGEHARGGNRPVARPAGRDGGADARETVLWKLDGLTERDVRRPLTPTGTNLLGLVKHLAGVELLCLGWVFDRHYAEPVPWFRPDLGPAGLAPNTDQWATAEESRQYIVDTYRKAWQHADAAIEALPLDVAGHVPWWPAQTGAASRAEPAGPADPRRGRPGSCSSGGCSRRWSPTSKRRPTATACVRRR